MRLFDQHGYKIIQDHGIRADAVESFNTYLEMPQNRFKVVIKMKDGSAQVLTGEKNEATAAAS